MTYLIDTDRVAEYLKGRIPAVSILPTLVPQGLAISIITFGEIYEGIYYGHNPEAQEVGFRRFLRSTQVIPLNRRTMTRFARIRGTLRRAGQLIGDPDILIAATAIEKDLTLITNNRRHFDRIGDLRLFAEN